MVDRGQGHAGAPPAPAASVGLKKKDQALKDQLEQLIRKCSGAFKQVRSFERARILLLSQLVCLGRHTVTGLICASARQFQDWSADYRLLSAERFDPDYLFRVILREAVAELDGPGPVVAAMDDTILRKSSRKTSGVAYRRDPLGPKFQTNLVLAQRFLQLAIALPPRNGAGPARTTPVAFVHAPTPQKPGQKASPAEWAEYKRLQKETNLGEVAVAQIQKLRRELDADERTRERPLWMVVDGGFTNGKVIKSLPAKTVLIGRVRKDAKLHHPATAEEQPAGAGKRKRYGRRAPTPEQLRQDPEAPWRTVKVFAAGKMHEFKVKTMSPVLWEKAGAAVPLRLVVIAPLAYRPRQGSRRLYRQPAYLICTDPEAPLTQVLQAYVWRWEIEVNHRDEKQLIGVGEAQVHNRASVERGPMLAVAAYSLLLLAARRAYPAEVIAGGLAAPKWRQGRDRPRLTTKELMDELRAELLREAIGSIRPNLRRLREGGGDDLKPAQLLPDPIVAMLYPAA